VESLERPFTSNLQIYPLYSGEDFARAFCRLADLAHAVEVLKYEIVV
jgi:hypothetical protein